MERILIVDDSRDHRNLLKIILKKRGYELIEAEHGVEAIAIAQKVYVDLILLDVIMPVMDGYQTCEILKTKEETQAVPIIFLSAKDEISDKIRGLELGAADYITKPFDKVEVVARVQTQLKIHGLTRSLAKANQELVTKQVELEADLAAAAQIQKSLIPATNPQIDNSEFAFRFIPSDLSGGDIFNVHRIDEEHTAIYIVDVSGHGVPAAMVTVSVAQSLQPHGQSILKRNQPGHPFYSITEPKTVLEKLDREYPLERFDKYFTTVYALLNTQTGHLRYANAAHPMPILIRRSGKLDLLEAGGPIIGMGDMVPFEQGETVLEAGDRLYLYTDGIAEYANEENEFYEEKRLYEELLRQRSSSLDDSCKNLLKAVEQFSGGRKAQDDITLLALEFGNDFRRP